MSESTIMYRIPRLLSRAALLALVAAMLVLSACSSGIKGDDVATSKLEKHFDLTVQAYKNDQFLLDGALLSPVDLGGHFAYLKDRNRLPRTVLVLPSDESKIHKGHLLTMARLELDYGFAVYYRNKDKLMRIAVTNKQDIPDLRDVSKPSPLPDENAGKTARGSNGFPTGGGQ